MKDDKMILEGLVVEGYPNAMFHVLLEKSQTLVLGYISGKIRQGSIRILTGDRVLIEISRYDLTKGRIIYRLPRGCSSNSDDSEDED